MHKKLILLTYIIIHFNLLTAKYVRIELDNNFTELLAMNRYSKSCVNLESDNKKQNHLILVKSGLHIG